MTLSVSVDSENPNEVRDAPQRRPLTQREMLIARLVASGRTNRRIAEHLGLSVRTIDAHISRIYKKVRIHTRAELSVLVASASLASRSE